MDDLFLFDSSTSMQAKSRESVLGRGVINPQVGEGQLQCNWDIYILSQCSRELKMKLRGRVTL